MANHQHAVQHKMMKRGLYRTFDSFLGECAKVHESAGDAFPFLRPEIYDALGFSPAYSELPLVEASSADASAGSSARARA